MRAVEDHRFGDSTWAMDFVVAPVAANDWMSHLAAEMEARNWTWTGISQLDSTANSGSMTLISAPGPSAPSIEVVWKKNRGKDLRVWARTGGEPALDLAIARELFSAVDKRVQNRTMLRAHQRALLAYTGLPWRGELWLDADTRLGPPSKFPNSLLGPQNIVVDLMVEGIGHQGLAARRQRRLEEIRVFLGILLGINPTPVRSEYGWVTSVDPASGEVTSAMAVLGYSESDLQPAFPQRGLAKPIQEVHVVRPGLGPHGITPDVHERWVPSDTEHLWQQFIGLPPARKEQLLHAGNAYSIAQSLWPSQRTAYAAFVVVACEALKPPGRRFEDLNMYDVVASLFSLQEATALRHQYKLHPQKVRSDHVHRGRLEAGELLPLLLTDFFADPAFDEMLRRLTMAVRTCMIEWLRGSGQYKVIPFPRARSSSRGAKSTGGAIKNAI